MKKKFFSYFTAIFLAGAATSVVCSQDFNNTAMLKSKLAAKNNFSSLLSNPTSHPGPLYLNEVASKAIRHYTKSYKDAVETKWFRLTDGTDGFVVYFTNDGVQTKVLYDKKGNYYCLFRNYFEDKLVPAVRHRVKTIYYDFNIYHINEVNINDKAVYIIMLEDKTCWKRVLVTEDEIVAMEEISKHWSVNRTH